MIKRTGKITSFLLAAATITSLMPLSAASAATVKKIDSEDGTVYNAIAYKDGKFYVDGEINDEEGAYYVSNGKFKELDDVDSGDDVVAYGEKYLDVNDGDYTVDLSSGSVSDDNIIDDTKDDVATALRKKLKSDDADDRYTDDAIKNIKSNEDLTEIPGGAFATLWYSTTYSNKQNSNGSASELNVFTDTKGNYIDADYNLGKVKVTTTKGSVDIKNTDDKYDISNVDDAVSASVKQLNVLAQDSDYIYRLVEVKIKVEDSSAGGIKEINGRSVGTGMLAVSSDGLTATFPAIQKISKAQSSSDIDGAKYAKTVTTYALSDDSAKKLDNVGLFLSSYDYDSYTIADNVNYTVAGGKLIAYTTDSDLTSTSNNGKVLVNAYTLKSKSSYYYADEEDQSKEDVETNKDDSYKAAISVDANGNLWRLDGGYIYKFDNTDDWDKVYKVDGSMDELSVYDEDNMAVWSEDDEVYSLIGGKTTDKDDSDKDDDKPQVTTGFVKNTDGTWCYNKADGTKATGWFKDGDTWYYFNASGIMQTGWLQDGSTWYYLNSWGGMQTGWANIGGTWYYLNSWGGMQTGWLDLNGTWYYLNGSGAMQTGWINVNGTWYYLYSNGAMACNTVVNGYTLASNGAWV